MAKVVLAVSGGVDSMVMLDMTGECLFDDIVKQSTSLKVYGCARMKTIVATFNHGTRPSADDDEKFVQRISGQKYRLPCFVARSKLGENVAEATAREQRYEFLRSLANRFQVPEGFLVMRSDCDESTLTPPVDEPLFIYTAHHLDDLVESIAINLIRGTGWRGLAVLDTPGIRRPFLEPELLPKVLRNLAPFDKKAIQCYAADYEITYRQDPTNNESNYLRNRLREKLQNFEYKLELYQLWQKQKKLKHEIDNLVQELLPKIDEPWQRSWFLQLDAKVALELLRAGLLRVGVSATRPQLEDFRQAILTYAPGKYFNLPGDKLVKINNKDFNI